MIRKRGQTEFMSVGVIFSIIIVIALIAVSIYVVTTFMGIGQCADLGLFKESFQDSVDRAWSSEITSEVFTGRLPGGMEAVCFSEGKEITAVSFQDEYQELRRYVGRGNVFFYPAEEACDQPYIQIEHLDLTGVGWSCFPVVDGKVSIGLEKGSFDSLVKIKDVAVQARK